MGVDGNWVRRHDEPDLGRAVLALHQRAGLACRAASAAGVRGQFRAWEQGGVLAVLATDPALAFLSTVCGVTRRTVPAALDLIRDPVWTGVTPNLTVSIDHDDDSMFRSSGLVRTADRALAVRRLDTAVARGTVLDLRVVDADDDGAFVEVLLGGYLVDGALAAYITAEHRHPAVRRFLVVDDRTPVAAAAMTVHGDVAVLGGASTPPVHRRRGAQSKLIEHRAQIAADLGCTLAVATVRPGSPSEQNLRKAGFRIHLLATWTRPPSQARA